VTGGGGFLGGHVLAELERRGVDPLCTYRTTPPADKFRSIQCDIYDLDDDYWTRFGEPDTLLHLSWGGLPNYGSDHHVERELPCQYEFLSNLIRSGLKKVIIAGTCFEYGMQSGALAADANTKPTNPYGYAKDYLRRQLKLLQSEEEFDLIWARLFYTWGEGQGVNSLFGQLQQAVESGQSTFNMSGGEQLRDYLPITVVASKLVDLVLSEQSADVLNICSGEPISVRRLVESWIKDYGWEIKLNLGFYPYSEYEPMAFWGVTPS